MSRTIMAVGAHIGDAQLTSGMLLAKHAMAGDRIITVDLTAGERGTPKGMTPEEFRPQNVAGAAEFARMLGGESIVFDIPDGELYDSKELELKLARIMREKQVDTVLYHWTNSMHKDHVNANRITDNAIFFASLPTFSLDNLAPAPIRRSLYAEAMKLAEQQGKDYTDDCQLIEALGKQVTMTTGSYSNIKLTTPEDFAIAEALLREQQKEADA